MNAQAVIDHIDTGVVLVDAQLNVLSWNRYLEVHSGIASSLVVNTHLWEHFPEIDRVWLTQKINCVFMLKNYSFSSWRERPYLFRMEIHQPLFGAPELMRQDVTFIPTLKPGSNEVESVAIVVANAQEAYRYQAALSASVDELQRAYAELKTQVEAREAMEAELGRVHYLDAVGRLAGGIAHELNSPLQFTTDSVTFVEESLDGLWGAVETYAAPRADAPTTSPLSELQQEDLAFMKDAAPRAIRTIKQGLERMAKIVTSMKDFARDGPSEMAPNNINLAIENAIEVGRSAFTRVASLELELSTLPPVVCDLGALKLTVLNLVVNAAHAIEEVVRDTGTLGTIRVVSRIDGDMAEIAISDTGGGIREEIRAKIFNPFFTTKNVGQGSGQGLALAYSTVVKQHGGRLTFETELGKGTTFSIRIPVAGPSTHQAPIAIE